MRILIFGINYAPELTGIGKYTGEMAAWLNKSGHDVSIVTSFPYYPEWEKHKSYKNKLWMKEKLENVTVYRCPLYVPKKVTSVKRIIHEMSFLLGALPILFMCLFKKKYDVVFCISPPFHLGLLPMIIAKIRGSKFITHIQDLQIDAARDLGMINNPTVLNVMFDLEKIILKGSDVVYTLTQGMRAKIVGKGISRSKIRLLPNWVDENVIHPLPVELSLRKEFGISEDQKVVLYSGNLGAKQGLEMIIEVAAALKKRKDLVFLIVGSGGMKESLKESVAEQNLTNVKFFPLQSYDRLSSLLATADLHLILQKQAAADLVMPSKLTAILASGGCTIVTATPGSSLYETIFEHNLGIIIPPDSPSHLINAISEALSSDLSSYRRNARHYSEQYLSKENILSELDSSLRSITAPEKIAAHVHFHDTVTP